MSFPASPRPRVSPSDWNWPRIYACCAAAGFALGLLVLGPLLLGPPRLPIEMHWSIRVGR